MRQAYCEYLIRTDTSVRWSAVNNVIQIAALLIPQQAIEAPFRESNHAVVSLPRGFITQTSSNVLHNANRVVPERLNFHRLAASWRNNPLANLRVHPGQLHAWLARVEQTSRIELYAEARSASMPGNDVVEDAI